MTGVRIDVSADAAQVVAAMETIKRAIASAGGAGKEWSKIDFGHSAEMKAFAADVEKVRANLESLTRIGRGATAQAARAAIGRGGRDPLALFEAADRQFPNKLERDRYVSNVGSFITQGTRFAPQQQAAQPPPGQWAAGGGVGGGGGQTPVQQQSAKNAPQLGGAGLFNALTEPMKIALGAIGLGGALAVAGRAIGNAEGESTDNDKLYRTLQSTTSDFETLRKSVRQASDGLGITFQQTQRLAESYSKITGYFDDRGMRTPGLDGVTSLTDTIHQAGGMARGFGLDQDSAVQSFARLDRAGISLTTAAGLLGDTMRSGAMVGQGDQVLQALAGFADQERNRLAGSHLAEFAGAYADLNRSGIRGDAAQGLLGTANAAVMQGGAAGMASQMLTYRALYAQGIRNPYAIQKLQEGGMFARTRPGGPTVFEAERAEIEREYHGNSPDQVLMRENAMGRHFGTTMHGGEALLALSSQDVNRTSRYLADHGMTLAGSDATGISGISAALAPGADLVGLARSLGARHDITGEEHDRLGTDTGSKLQEDIVRTLAAHGMTPTEGSKLVDANAKLENALTSLGTELIPPMNSLKSNVGELGSQVSRAVDVLKEFLPSMDQIGPGLAPGGLLGTLKKDVQNTLSDPLGFHPSRWHLPAGLHDIGGSGTREGGGDDATLLARYGTIATRIGNALGVAPSSILGQIRQETGGRGDYANNPFNMQAGPTYTGNTVTRGDTHADGSHYATQFRAYSSLEQAANDYVGWAKRHSVGGTGDDALAFGNQLKRGGFAEDPGYAAHVASQAGRFRPRAGHDGVAGGSAGAQQITISPLRVIHQTPEGAVKDVEFLPFTSVFPAKSYGT